MKKSRLMELANVAVTEGGGDTSWIKDPQVRSKVDAVIKALGSLYGPGETVDGETMQFILEAIGMDEQMLKQLKNSSVSFSDIRENVIDQHFESILDGLKLSFQTAYEKGLESAGSYDDFDKEYWNRYKPDLLDALKNSLKGKSI